MFFDNFFQYVAHFAVHGFGKRVGRDGHNEAVNGADDGLYVLILYGLEPFLFTPTLLAGTNHRLQDRKGVMTANPLPCLFASNRPDVKIGAGVAENGIVEIGDLAMGDVPERVNSETEALNKKATYWPVTIKRIVVGGICTAVDRVDW